MFCLCYRLLERNAKSFVFWKGDYDREGQAAAVVAIKLNYSHKNTPSSIILLVSSVIETSYE